MLVSCLTDMGYRAVLPLIECLNAQDKRLQGTVITILADIGDPRALPMLMAIADNPETNETERLLAKML